jgi:hypothetical protein
MILLKNPTVISIDPYIDKGASILKGFIHALVNIKPEVLILLIVCYAFVYFGLNLVRTSIRFFYYLSGFTAAILIVNYMLSPKK